MEPSIHKADQKGEYFFDGGCYIRELSNDEDATRPLPSPGLGY